MERVYLDYAAATPLNAGVKKSMDETQNFFGNPSSIHEEGKKAKEIVERSRKKIAGVLGAKAGEVIFTSGGTESNNLAIFGVAKFFSAEGGSASGGKNGHIITSKIEHPSVLEPIKELQKDGFNITYIEVNNDGIVNLEDIKKAMRDDTILISIIYANNEIGTIQQIREIGRIIKSHKPYTVGHMPYFHIDACQASEYLNLKVESLGVDLLSANASKIYGPKGVGFLYKKNKVKIYPQILGGGQEDGVRSGTESPELCAGLSRALEIAEENKEKESRRLSELRDYFIEKVLSQISSAELNGSKKNRLPNNINFNFKGCDVENLLVKLDLKGIACSTGSACSSQFADLSHVILALGKGDHAARSSIRFSLGRQTNNEELNYVIKVLCETLKN